MEWAEGVTPAETIIKLQTDEGCDPEERPEVDDSDYEIVMDTPPRNDPTEQAGDGGGGAGRPPPRMERYW